MVAPRLGTHSRGLPTPGCARALSPDRRNGETRSSLTISGMGLQPGTGSHIKRLVQKGVLTCGQRWLQGAGLRTSNPAAGSA